MNIQNQNIYFVYLIDYKLTIYELSIWENFIRNLSCLNKLVDTKLQLILCLHGIINANFPRAVEYIL
jgi:hypothetical protein